MGVATVSPVLSSSSESRQMISISLLGCLVTGAVSDLLISWAVIGARYDEGGVAGCAVKLR